VHKITPEQADFVSRHSILPPHDETHRPRLGASELILLAAVRSGGSSLLIAETRQVRKAMLSPSPRYLRMGPRWSRLQKDSSEAPTGISEVSRLIRRPDTSLFAAGTAAV
jgi:hypothetical protein